MAETENWEGPLAGVRVLDFTRVLAGPAASLALADLGAEVIKIEATQGGDDTRSFPPHRAGESHYFIAVNRGKQSLAIDLKTEQGAAIVRSLVVESDILIENFRPGVMARLGLGYETLAEINPRLIYCAISGFGMSGPLRDRPSFDIVMQAFSGAMSVNGSRHGEPVKLGLPMGDLVGGINAPIAILAALYDRERTGSGLLIDISLHDGMLNLLGYLAQYSFFTEEDPEPQGNEHLNLVPYGAFPARDGSVVIACLTNQFWSKICEALQLQSLLDEPSLSTLEGRRLHRERVHSTIADATRTWCKEELAAHLLAHGVPHAPILTVSEALSHPQTTARNMVTKVEHSTLGEIPVINRPFRFPDKAMRAVGAPPVLGQHSVSVLKDHLHLSEEDIVQLHHSGVVYAAGLSGFGSAASSAVTRDGTVEANDGERP